MNEPILTFLDSFFHNLEIYSKQKNMCIFFMKDSEVIFEYTPYTETLIIENYLFKLLNSLFNLKEYEVINIIRKWFNLKYNYKIKIILKFTKPSVYIVEDWFKSEIKINY